MTKKILFACILLGILLLAGIICMESKMEIADAANKKAAENPMALFMEERSRSYSDLTQQLNDIIHASETQEAERSLAQRMLMDHREAAYMQSMIENSLRLRGIEAVSSVNRGFACIFVNKAMLTSQEASIIYEHVSHETGLSKPNIKIIPVNCPNF